MKKIDLSGKSKDELKANLKELREKLVQLNFDLADKKLKDVSQFNKIRRDIARILTALNMSRSL